MGEVDVHALDLGSPAYLDRDVWSRVEIRFGLLHLFNNLRNWNSRDRLTHSRILIDCKNAILALVLFNEVGIGCRAASLELLRLLLSPKHILFDDRRLNLEVFVGIFLLLTFYFAAHG